MSTTEKVLNELFDGFDNFSQNSNGTENLNNFYFYEVSKATLYLFIKIYTLFYKQF